MTEQLNTYTAPAVLWVDFGGAWKKQGVNYRYQRGRNRGSLARVEVGRRRHILDTFPRKSRQNFLTERMGNVKGKRSQKRPQAVSLSN